MSDDRETLHDAINVAIDRTADAQARVDRELREHGTPSLESTERVVRRANDVTALVDEDLSAGDELDEDEADELDNEG